MKHNKAIFKNHFAIILLILINSSCQKSEEIGFFVHYSLYPIDGGKIEFLPAKDFYELGDIVTMVAIPDSGRSFYRWEGDTICYDSAITIEVNDNPKTICALFPLKLLKDSILILGSYPDSVLPKGEIAYFNFSLNYPYDSCYSVYCVCKDYQIWNYLPCCSKIYHGISVGAAVDSITSRDTWYISIYSDLYDEFIYTDTLIYNVRWQ